MRKQYHLWPAGTGFDAWDVDRLISLARGLPVHAVTVESVCEVDTVYWFDGSTTAPTVRAIVKHARLMLDADLSFPVILGPDGRVMDGMHRIARVMLEGRTEVSAVRFLTLPEPDHRTASPPISILTSIPELTEHSAVSASSARPAARDAAARPRRSARGGRRPAEDQRQREKDRSVSLYAGDRSPEWVRWRQVDGFRGWHRDGAALGG